MGRASRVWHPNTQMSEWHKFPEIRAAKGVWLVDSDGNKMIDAVASMWCNVWGHSERRLVSAMRRQAGILQHSPLFNLTHEPAEELAGMLVDMSPGMSRAFFSDNGSSAMEIAVKMAIQYMQNTGEKRPVIAALHHGYHGDTMGAMSVGFMEGFFFRFKRYAFPVSRLPSPGGRPPRGTTASGRAEQCLDIMERRLARGDVAALVMESGAQVAGGALVYPDGFQQKAGRLCKKYGTLLVLDEIATGLGRLGSMVQYVEQGCSPDIVSYGKMLTGGYITMAATLATKKVYEAFLGKFGEQRHLFHGHTYTGNPVAAAVAMENLRMYEERDLVGHVRDMSRHLGEMAPGLLEMGMVRDVRYRGLLMGIELEPGIDDVSANQILFEAGRKNGIYLRTLGRVVLLVPPLAITEKELGMMIDRAEQTIRDAWPKLMA